MILLLACVQKPPAVLRPTAPQAVVPIAPVEARGTYTGTVNSPSGPVPLRVEVVDEATPVLLVQQRRFTGTGRRTGNQVDWTFPALAASIRGTLDATGFRGQFEQLGRRVPLQLDRSKAL